MIFQDVVVGIPAIGIARVKLHETHTTLDHATGEQAACAELFGRRMIDAVEMLRSLGFTGDVHGLGRGGLHAEGQLVGANASIENAVAFMPGEMGGIHLLDEIQRGTLTSATLRTF